MENSDLKFCLKWNDFQHNFMSEFESLKENEDFVDVTLYCYGQCIKAHKIVLSACSPYLKNIFKEHPSKHPIIILDNLSFNNLKAVIQFVYTGQVYIEQEELPSFLKAAETLQIRGLSESSNSQNLVQTNLTSINENNTSIFDNKREADGDCESKRLRNKKVRRISNNSAKESNESNEEQKKNDVWTNNPTEEIDETPQITPNREIEQPIDAGDKVVNLPNGDEYYSQVELKRLHWLIPRSCTLCNRVYSNLSNLRQHIKLIHNPTLVTCKLCNKTFKTDLYLRRHLISFHEVNINGNGSNLLSVDLYKQIPNQGTEWQTNIKMEPEFQDIFNESDICNVPE